MEILDIALNQRTHDCLPFSSKECKWGSQFGLWNGSVFHQWSNVCSSTHAKNCRAHFIVFNTLTINYNKIFLKLFGWIWTPFRFVANLDLCWQIPLHDRWVLFVSIIEFWSSSAKVIIYIAPLRLSFKLNYSYKFFQLNRSLGT